MFKMKKEKTRDNIEFISLEAKVLLHIVSRMSRQDTEKRLKKENFDLKPLSFGVLCALRKRSCTIAQLSKRLMISPPTLIPIVDSLEKKGYLKRGINPNDRRKNPLILTEKSRKLSSRMLKLSGEDNLIKNISKLGKIRASLLVNLLEELVESMSSKKKLDDIKAICRENAQ
jgi:DNA-binding MarR family transcriptional regulator